MTTSHGTNFFKRRMKDLPEDVRENIASLLERGEFEREPLFKGIRSPFYSSSRVFRENIDKIFPVEKLPDGALPAFDRTSEGVDPR